MEYNSQDEFKYTLGARHPKRDYGLLEGQGAKPLDIPSDNVISRIARSVTFNEDNLKNDTETRNAIIQEAKYVGINPDIVFAGGKDGVEQLHKMANIKKASDQKDIIQKAFPELATMEGKSDAEKTQIFLNADDVKVTSNVFRASYLGARGMYLNMKRSNLGHELMQAKTPEEQAEIWKQIGETERELQDTEFLPLNDGIKMVHDTVAQFTLMGTHIGKGAINRGTQGAVVGGAVGTTVMPALGTVGGLSAGLKYGTELGMAEQMYKESYGNKVLELYARKNKGELQISNEEIHQRAVTHAMVDAGIEFGATMLLGKAFTGWIPKGALSKMLSKGAFETFKEGIAKQLGKAVGRAVGSGATEITEEALQGINEKAQDYYYERGSGHEPTFDEILEHGVNSAKESVHAVVGISLATLFMNAVGIHVTNKRYKQFSPQKLEIMTNVEKNQRGAEVVDGIIKDKETNKLAKDMPDLYNDTIDKMAKRSDIDITYINVHELIGDKGTEFVSELVNKGVLTHEEVANAIENETPIQVPIGSFAQLVSEVTEEQANLLKDITTYSEDHKSNYALRQAQAEQQALEKQREEYKKTKLAEQKENFVNKNFGKFDEDAKTILRENLTGDREGTIEKIAELKSEIWQEITNIEWLKEDLSKIIADAQENATSFEEVNDATLKGLENLIEKHSKSDSIYHEHDIVQSGILRVISGDKDFQRKVKGLRQTTDLLNKLENMDDSKFIEGFFSKEANEVYTSLVDKLGKHENYEVKTNAKNYALLYTSHAEAMAEKIRQTGKEDYTAKDFFDEFFNLEVGGEFDGSVGLLQSYEENSQKKDTSKGVNKATEFPWEESLRKVGVQWKKDSTLAFSYAVLYHNIDIKNAEKEKLLQRIEKETDEKIKTELTGKLELLDEEINGLTEEKDLMLKNNKVLADGVENGFYIMQSPLVMELVGEKANIPLKMKLETLIKILLVKHGDDVSLETIQQLPHQLANPEKIVRNFSRGKYRDGCVFIISLKGKHGNITVPIAMKKEKGGKAKGENAQYIKTSFSRSSDAWLRNSEKYGGVLYDKKRRTQPKSSTIQVWHRAEDRSGSSVRIIPNEEDLVKLREKYNNELYQKGSKVRGLTSLYENGEKMMHVFSNADASTFIHECGHVFLEDLRMIASMDGATEQTIADWELLKKEYGYIEGGTVDENRQAHEKFAKHFEAWVREGKAPTKPLAKAFYEFKNYLIKIYKTLTSLGGSPSKDVERVMARMVATSEQIDDWAKSEMIDTEEWKNLFGMSDEDARAMEEELIGLWTTAYKDVMQYVGSEKAEKEIEKWKNSEDFESDIEELVCSIDECYGARRLYNMLGEEALAITEFNSIEEVAKAEQEKLGSYDEVLAKAREDIGAFFSELNDDVAKAKALGYLTKKHRWVREELAVKEISLLRKTTNKAIADTFKHLTALENLDWGSEEFEEELSKYTKTPIERLRDKKNKQIKELKEENREKLSKLRNEKNEKIEEIKEDNKERIAKLKEREKARREKYEGKVEKLKAELKDRLKNLRTVRDTKFKSPKALYEDMYTELSNRPLSEARAWKRYQNKVVTIRRQIAHAMVMNDVEKALSLSYSQLKYASKTRVAHDIDKKVNSTTKRWKKQYKAISRSKNPIRLEKNGRYLIQNLLYKMGITKEDGVMPDDYSIAKVINLLDPDAELTDEESLLVLDDAIMGILDKGKNFKSLTVNEFNLVSELIQAVYTRARYEYNPTHLVDEKGENVTYETAKEEMLSSTSLRTMDINLITKRNERTAVDKASDTIGSLMLPLTKVDVILKRLDGGKKGKWYRYLYDPIDKACSKLLQAQVENGKALENIFSTYERSELHTIRNERAYNIGKLKHMTKEEVMCVALNLGTKANRQRLEETLGMEINAIEQAVDTILEPKDWTVIEGVWNEINSYFKERAEVQERLYGVPLRKEEGVEFNADGRTIKGQYYPIVYDMTVDAKGSDQAKEDLIRSQTSSNAVWGVGMSATKKRNKTVKGRSLALNFNVITSALDEAVTHIHMREAVTEVNKLLNSQEISEFVVNALGSDTYQYLKKWVRDCWQAEITKTTKLERVLNRLSRNATFSVMSYRLSTAMLNCLNIIPMAERIGWLNMASAFKEFYGTKAKENWDFVISKSTMMANRNQTLDASLKKALEIDGKGIEYSSANGEILSKTADKLKAYKEKVDDYGFWLITKTDMSVALPLWKHAYDEKVAQCINEGYTDQAIIDSLAVSEGDRAVREIFGSGETKDSVGIQRGKSFVNIFTPFYTYANTVLNAQIDKFYIGKDTGNWQPLIMSMMHWIVIQGIMEYTLREGIKVMCGGDGDDWDEVPLGALSTIIETGVSGFPIIRDCISYLVDTAMGKRSYSRGGEVQMLSLLGKIEDVASNLASSKKSWIDVGRSVSQVSNRLVGFSDTATDGFWTLVKFLSEDTNATLLQAISSILFDKRIK